MAERGAPWVLTVDCSTTASKAIVWDVRGRCVSEGRAPIALAHPGPGAWEQDPEAWWSATCAAIRAAVEACGSPERIAAVCVTHQRETVAVLNADGTARAPARVWMDDRCAAQVDAIAAPLGAERVHALSGKVPCATPSLFKLAHWRQTRPDDFAGDVRVVDVHALVVWRLTGRLWTSLASADPMGLVDMAGRCWSPELLALAGLDEATLPELVAPGAVGGAVTRRGMEATGLPEGVPVIAGAGDGQSAGLGAGLVGPGRAYLNLGTAIVSGVCWPAWSVDRAYRTLYGPLDGTFLLETDLKGGTFTLTWWVERILGRRDVDAAFVELTEAASALEPGSGGLVALPYWAGVMNPFWDDDASGVLMGLRGGHTPAHVFRALLEGIALEQRLHTEGVEAATGAAVEAFVVMGGGARSALWCELIADITGRPVERAETAEATSLGAAVLAALGAGLYSAPDEAVAAMTRLGERFEPGAQRARYDALYREVYAPLYPALRDGLGALARWNRAGGASG